MPATRAKIDEARVSLTAAIEKWFDNDPELDLWYGANTSQIMATAAMAVLEGMSDAQQYMAENDILSENA